MKLLLSTSNSHKLLEFKELLKGSSVTLEKPESALEVEEGADSFRENALLKAQAYFQKFRRPSLADDSGLVVEALPEELAVRSARFGGEGLSDKQRAFLVLEKMQDFTELEQRRAYFVCYLCCYLDPSQVFFFEGRCHGKIAFDYRGEQGFGYDPIFIPDGHKDALPEATLAMLPTWKQQHSHRAKAARQLKSFFQEKQLPSF